MEHEPRMPWLENLNLTSSNTTSSNLTTFSVGAHVGEGGGVTLGEEGGVIKFFEGFSLNFCVWREI